MLKDDEARMIRVLIADDHPLMRKGLTDILNGVEGIEVVGAAEDGAAAIALAHAVKPDIVLMDISMPGMDGIECNREARGDGLGRARGHAHVLLRARKDHPGARRGRGELPHERRTSRGGDPRDSLCRNNHGAPPRRLTERRSLV